MKGVLSFVACLLMATESFSTVFVNQTPAQNGGTQRWSKLWIDPFGDNDLDSDAICYEDFTLAQDSQIEHLEWWGNHDPNLGFQIEFWRQDPGTIAYQPLAVFRDVGATPEAAFLTQNYAWGSDPSQTIHFSFDLPNPFLLAKNDASNPRWFVAIIARTNDAPSIWTWAQGLGGSTRTFQWNRADANNFRVLSEGRALLISGTALVPEPMTSFLLASGLGAYALKRRKSARD